MRVECGRPPHRLAGVVDDDVESRQVRVQPGTERLERHHISQIEPMQVQAMSKLSEVRLLCIPPRRVRGEAGGRDEGGTRAKQLQPRLVANLDARARQKRHAPRQIGGSVAHAIVERRTWRAQLRIEVVQLGESGFANVALLGCVQLGATGRARGAFRSDCRGARSRKCWVEAAVREGAPLEQLRLVVYAAATGDPDGAVGHPLQSPGGIIHAPVIANDSVAHLARALPCAILDRQRRAVHRRVLTELLQPLNAPPPEGGRVAVPLVLRRLARAPGVLLAL
mmetsp:Transcript_15353/g.63770  ORF Transcript_15353/g.63770 Transcript_15353/m.63770 type:complete len:281 (+) Transcript_15353:1064-1906(+)